MNGPFSSVGPGTRVTVMGLGTFGGGVGATRFLAGCGARVIVTDLRDEAALAVSRQQLDDVPGITWRLGGHCEEDFRETDLVVVNPAVPAESPWLRVAREAGVELTSEMNLFWQLNPAPVIAVTGSNGKSTTTAMIHAMLSARTGQAWLGGNLGGSLLGELERISPHDRIVLELSSFQLEDLDRIQAAPDVAVVTNLSPNHLDRHKTLAAYREAKQSILRWQTPGQSAVLCLDDPDVWHWQSRGQRLGFGIDDGQASGVFLEGDKARVRIEGVTREVPLGDWVQLPGHHNLLNAAAAACAALVAGAKLDDVQRGLQGFTGLPHRLQRVTEIDGRTFFNDSLATTPESVEVAVTAFRRPVVLLAGGYDKQLPLDGLAETIRQNVKAVALMGQTAGDLQRLLGQSGGGPDRSVCDSLEDAFDWAVERSEPGDTVLLSPGCASYDWFTSFRERGEAFEELARDWRPPTTAHRVA